jgi:Gas vesicle protein K/Gas vesicle protein
VSRSDLAPNRRGVALVDVLDETLATGVTAAGDIVLSVADVDLVVLRLRALLASVQSLYEGEIGESNGGSLEGSATSAASAPPEPAEAQEVEQSTVGSLEGSATSAASAPPEPAEAQEVEQSTGRATNVLPVARAPSGPATVADHTAPPESASGRGGTGRLNVDPQDVSKGLAQLILTVVELLRELMERQAIRRLEGGSLTEAQIERVGLGLKRLKEAVEGLREELGLDEEDLNLDLGPLGRLL